MADFSLASGSISNFVSNTQLTTPENQHEMPDLSAGASNGVMSNAAGNSSTPEERPGLPEGYPLYTSMEPAPYIDEATRNMLLAIGGVDVWTGRIHHAPVVELAPGSRAFLGLPPADSTASSSNATSGSNPDVDNAPLAGAAQPAETMDAGNSIDNAALPPFNGEHLGSEAQEHGQMGADNGAINLAAVQQNLLAADEEDMNFMGNFAQTLGTEHVDSSVIPATGGEGNVVAFQATLGDIGLQLLQMGADSSADNSAAPLDEMFDFNGFEEQPLQLGVDNGANNPVAFDATLPLAGSDQQPMQTGASSSANNLAAPPADLNGYAQQPQYTGAGNSASNPVAYDANFSLGGAVQQPFQMGAGNSAFHFNFAAQQQYPVAPQPTLNGGMQPYSAAPGAVDQMGQQLPTLNGSAQAYMPMAYYAQPQKYGYPANGMEFGHQQPISNGSMQPFFTAENAPAQELSLIHI